MNTAIAPEHAARTQSLFREINESTERLTESIADLTRYADWICECADVDCLERISLTIGEYKTVRETPTYFVVAPHYLHVVPEVEQIVGKTDRYWIVEKLGAAATIAIAIDENAKSDNGNGDGR